MAFLIEISMQVFLKHWDQQISTHKS